MTKKEGLDNLPGCAAEYIDSVIKKMRYRKKIRQDVRRELIRHFIDAVADCETAEEKELLAQKLIAEFGDVKILAKLIRRGKKRCRRLWRTMIVRFFQLIGLIILLFIFQLILFVTGRPNITIDYVAKVNRIVRPIADESLNAEPFYEKAVELAVKEPDDLPNLRKKTYADLTDEEKLKVQEWVNSNEEALEQVFLGSQKTYCWKKYHSNSGELISILLPELSESKELAKALCWRAWLKAEEGLYENAFSDIKTSYRFGKHINKGTGTLIEQLVGISMEATVNKTLLEILSEYRVDSALLAGFEKDYEDMIAGEDFVISFETERLFMYDEIQRCFTGERLGGLRGGALCLRGIGRLGMLSSDELFEKIVVSKNWAAPFHVVYTHPDKQESIEMANAYWGFWEKNVLKSPALIRAEGIDLDAESMKLVKGNILLEILLPAISKIVEISYRNKADAEATLGVIAILRYGQETGEYPENLNELVRSGYLKTLPMDPFSDGPLVYRKTDDDFMLYSVGKNFIDDGGKVEKDSKGEVRTWGSTGDVVFWPVD